jgi:hypothetical protein
MNKVFLLLFTMGYSSRFYVEAKSFEFICKKGVSIACVYKRSRGIVRSVSQGCEMVAGHNGRPAFSRGLEGILEMLHGGF